MTMTTGEVIAAICKFASQFDDSNYLVMTMNLYNIEVTDDYITLYTVDGNTRNIRIDKEGNEIKYDQYAEE